MNDSNNAQFGDNVDPSSLDLTDITEYIKNIADDWMQSNATTMSAEQKKLPGMLDERALYGEVLYSSAFIAVRGSTRQIEYYGGFEYIDEESKRTFGDYTMYLSEDEERVQSVLNVIAGIEYDGEGEE